MKRKLFKLSQRYQVALRTHLRQGQQASLEPARGLVSEALAAGLQTLELAKLHEQTLVKDILPACPPGKHAALIKQAGIFFAVAITPIEKNHHSAQQATLHLKEFIKTL